VVMSASVPPLAARISAQRCAVLVAAAGLMPGSAEHSAVSRANPSGSRCRAMTAARLLRVNVAVISPASEGRIRSALTTTRSARKNASCRHAARCRCPRSQASGTCRHAPFPASAPLASHRSCQLSPG